MRISADPQSPVFADVWRYDVFLDGVSIAARADGRKRYTVIDADEVGRVECLVLAEDGRYLRNRRGRLTRAIFYGAVQIKARD